MSDKRKEAHERAEHKRQGKDTFEVVAAERAKELEAIRQRTAELRALRVAQEKRGRVRSTVPNARVAKSVTKDETQRKSSHQTKN